MIPHSDDMAEVINRLVTKGPNDVVAISNDGIPGTPVPMDLFEELTDLKKDRVLGLVHGVDYRLERGPTGQVEVFFLPAVQAQDNVNHPSHYTHYRGLEVIDLTEQMNFNRGNAVKYVCRAGHKVGGHEIEDLKKAVWYLQREIKRLEELGGR